MIVWSFAMYAFMGRRNCDKNKEQTWSSSEVRAGEQNVSSTIRKQCREEWQRCAWFPLYTCSSASSFLTPGSYRPYHWDIPHHQFSLVFEWPPYTHTASSFCFYMCISRLHVCDLVKSHTCTCMWYLCTCTLYIAWAYKANMLKLTPYYELILQNFCHIK